MKNGVFKVINRLGGYSIGYYLNDIPEGLFKFFNNQGLLTHEVNFVNGKYHGLNKLYYNSIVKIIEIYDDGVKKEEKTLFDTGSVHQHYIFQNAKKNGAFIQCYEDGTVQIKGNFSDGTRNGEFIYYHRNGVIEKKELYVNGIRNRGLVEEFHDNGQLAHIITWYVDPQGNGVDNEFHPDGQPKKTSEYRNGLLEGLVIEHYDNGQIKFKGHYVKGKKHGTFTDYFKNGRVQQISNYCRNQLHGEFKKYRHKDGALIADYEHERGKRKRQREEEEEEQ